MSAFFRQYVNATTTRPEHALVRTATYDNTYLTKNELLLATATYALSDEAHPDVFAAWVRFYVEEFDGAFKFERQAA